MSRRRSVRSSSAAAGAGPSSLKCTRACGGCTSVSGTSNAPEDRTSLRPDGRSAVALLTDTTASRPTIRTLRSASRSAGRLSTGRSTQPVASASIDNPSSGTGGPPALSVSKGAFTAITMRSTVPLRRCSLNQPRTCGLTKIGHIRFRAPTGIRVPAKPAVKRAASRRQNPCCRTWRRRRWCCRYRLLPSRSVACRHHNDRS